jgi:hypothetical protein
MKTLTDFTEFMEGYLDEAKGVHPRHLYIPHRGITHHMDAHQRFDNTRSKIFDKVWKREPEFRKPNRTSHEKSLLRTGPENKALKQIDKLQDAGWRGSTDSGEYSQDPEAYSIFGKK